MVVQVQPKADSSGMESPVETQTRQPTAAEGAEEEEPVKLAAHTFSDADTQARGGFGVSVAELCGLMEHGEDEANKRRIAGLGGQAGVAEKLLSDLDTGISGTADELASRREIFYTNAMPERPKATFLELFIEAYKDPVLIILLVAAVISVIIGLIGEEDNGWIDGVAIFIATLIVSIVGAGNDYKKQLQFLALEEASDSELKVKVTRGGKLVEILVPECVVGDLVSLEAGDQVPADGLCTHSDKCKVSSASLTGESLAFSVNTVKNPIILSGMQVTEGTCSMLVVAVGERSMQGRIRKATSQEAKDTPLQEKLEDMVKLIGYVGVGCAILTFAAMMIQLATVDTIEEEHGVGGWVLEAFIIAVTIIVVAIPEGLPLAVTISLAYSTRKMMADQNLVRVLAACETMGNATDICSDKTGTLTENRMTVVRLWVPPAKAVGTEGLNPGVFCKSPEASQIWDVLPDAMRGKLLEHMSVNTTAFIQDAKDEKKKAMGLKEVTGSQTAGAGLFFAGACGFDPTAIRSKIMVEGRYLKHHLFASSRKMASTVVVLPEDDPSGKAARIYLTGAPEYVLGRCISWLHEDGTSVELTDDNRSELRGHQKGMAQLALRTLGFAYRELDSLDELPGYTECPPEVLSGGAAEGAAAEGAAALSGDARNKARSNYFMDTDQEWFTNPHAVENWDAAFDPLKPSEGHATTDGFTFYALCGIQDPLREGVQHSVEVCQKAGIRVRMVTGDNRDTAEAIARKCGILTEGGLVVEGPAFRRLSAPEVDALLPRLQVMARSSPDDKNWLVRRLNGNLPTNEEDWKDAHPGVPFTEENRRLLMPGYFDDWKKANYNEKAKTTYKPVVGVTGDGTNDAPALKAADVGLSMGIAGTDVARNASDIVILDDNFKSIVQSVKWGRSVYDNIRKFLQFQLTVNVVALGITLIAAVAQRRPPLNAVMMLWVNLIMDSLGALALGTEAPTDSLLLRKPFVSHASLISPKMWRNILVQSAFQLILLMAFMFTENSVTVPTLDSGAPDPNIDADVYLNSYLFNAFVFCQIFNEFNARSIDDTWNVFSNLGENVLFGAVIVATVGLQIFIVEVGGDFTKTTGLTLTHWGETIGLGLIAVPLGVMMRWIPVENRPKDFADYYLKSAEEAAAEQGSTTTHLAEGAATAGAAAEAASDVTVEDISDSEPTKGEEAPDTGEA